MSLVPASGKVPYLAFVGYSDCQLASGINEGSGVDLPCPSVTWEPRVPREIRLGHGGGMLKERNLCWSCERIRSQCRGLVQSCSKQDEALGLTCQAGVGGAELEEAGSTGEAR